MDKITEWFLKNYHLQRQNSDPASGFIEVFIKNAADIGGILVYWCTGTLVSTKQVRVLLAISIATYM